jgi:uncharacterized damage-inducible protein DinB
MPRRDEIRDLFVFNQWANARTLGATAPLTEEEFGRDLKSSYPSVRETLLHIMASEWVWLMRWQGTSPTAQPAGWADYGHADIEQEWRSLQSAQLAFTDRISEGDVERAIQYTNLRGETFAQPLWQLMRHMVNHSTYHRGQITTMLRQLGHPAVATDLVLYYRQQQPTLQV